MKNPEVLAPAGDQDSLRAALAAGADAVYFGLDVGFNARARAGNFDLENLEATVRRVHEGGARAYLTLNTLIFESELEYLESLLPPIAEAGVDALIVADPAVALMARRVAPDLELHASTQMTISSGEGAEFAAELGVTRVVVPREFSVEEIRRFSEATELEIEVFIIGALCMAWSGQCLSSEAWGGRSANRGQCAQACRLPYELLVDGKPFPLGDVRYLLSPRDLAGFRAVKDLQEMGVATLKIEGRQKGPVYVHTAVSSLKRFLDQPDPERLSEDLRDMSLAYSRGFGDGFLAGSDHQTLVDGKHPRHRGVCLGTVTAVEGSWVTLGPPAKPPRGLGEVSSPLEPLGGSPVDAGGAAVAPLEPRPGMGVLFLQGDEQSREQGGPIFEVKGSKLRFGQPGPDLNKVRVGAEVYVTGDPKLNRRVDTALNSDRQFYGRPLSLKVSGVAGQPLVLETRFRNRLHRVESESALEPASKRGLSPEVLEEKLGALGQTPFRLGALEVELEENLFLPLSQLKSLRRRLVERLEGALHHSHPVLDRSPLTSLRSHRPPSRAEKTELVVLCREQAQLEAALACGIEEVELDWMELVGLNAPVAQAREAGARVCLATVRVQKPGEEVYDSRLRKLLPDAVLVRHWGGLVHFSRAETRPVVHGDFSLNVTNSLTAHHLLDRGLTTVTASHDLDATQLRHLLEQVSPASMAVTIHHHIPTFHTEHCLYSALLSNGRDYRTCGRPCEKHQLSLKDRVDLVHPVVVDVGCRNTVFNAAAQSAAFLVPELVERGVARLRIEFVREDYQQALEVIRAYQELMAGEIDHQQVIDRLGVMEQFGVSAGTMEVAR